jgi:hypothetical protein
MKRLLLLFIFLLVTLVIIPDSAEAQKRRRGNIGSFAGNKRLFNPAISFYGIGGGISALNYFGDIAPTSGIASTKLSFTRPALNLFIKQKFGDRYHWRANLMYGRLQSSDVQTVGENNFTPENANRYLRNLSFRNDILELSLTGQIDLFKFNGKYTRRAPLNIYAFGGLGIIYHNPKGKVPEYFSRDAFKASNPIDFTSGANPRYFPLEQSGEWVSLRNLGTEGQFLNDEARANYLAAYGKDLPTPYSRVQIVIPVGIGVRYKLTNNFDLGLEISYRHTFTDYLDDVSGEYLDLGAFGDPSDPNAALAMAMSDRSNQFTQAEFDQIRNFTYNANVTNYSSNLSDLEWRRAAGYGNAGGEGNNDPRSNIRGNRDDNDIYIVTNIQLTYILGRSFVRNAKFR